MKLAYLTLVLAAAATTACTAERAIAPQVAGHSSAKVDLTGLPQIPLLFVVDGVRLQRDQVPSLTKDEISQVRVLKGRAALERYGPDGSYGVVEITTKAAAARRS
jgi:outer membrane receptor for ferrienterochelin and colicin